MPEFVLKVHQFYHFLRPGSQGTRNVAISSRCGNMHITLFPDMRKIAPCLKQNDDYSNARYIPPPIRSKNIMKIIASCRCILICL